MNIVYCTDKQRADAWARDMGFSVEMSGYITKDDRTVHLITDEEQLKGLDIETAVILEPLTPNGVVTLQTYIRRPACSTLPRS